MRSNLFFIRVKDDFCLALSCLKSSIRSSTAINLALLPEMFTRMNYIQKLYTNSYNYNLQFTFTILKRPNSNSQKNYQANSKTINRINENCLSVQVLPSFNCSHLYFLTPEFLISVHANLHHTSSNQGSNESLNARMSFTTIASSLVLLSISC